MGEDDSTMAVLADRVEAFLEEAGARTERETYSETDVRVLATTD